MRAWRKFTGLCEIGQKVTTEKSNYFKRGCWNGVLMEKYRNEIHDKRDTSEQ